MERYKSTSKTTETMRQRRLKTLGHLQKIYENVIITKIFNDAVNCKTEMNNQGDGWKR